MNDKEVESFCHKYEARVKISQTRMARYNMPDNYFYDPKEKFTAEYLTNFHVTAVDVTMPEDRFRTLVEMERRVCNIAEDLRAFEMHTRQKGRGWFEEHMEQQRQEYLVRNRHPAVKKAWDNYQMLFNLVKDNK